MGMLSKGERRPVLVCGPSLTIQADKDRTDIRNVVARAMRGKSTSVHLLQGESRDISDLPSYMEAMNVVARANQMFEQLPSALRDRFGNDPRKLLAFMDNKDNLDEARKLGLVKPEPTAPTPPEPITVRVVSDPPAKA